MMLTILTGLVDADEGLPQGGMRVTLRVLLRTWHRPPARWHDATALVRCPRRHGHAAVLTVETVSGSGRRKPRLAVGLTTSDALSEPDDSTS